MLVGCNSKTKSIEKVNENVDSFTEINTDIEGNIESEPQYIPANSSTKEFVNNATRGYYYTFDLGDGVEAEYSFNDGVSTVTTYLYGSQFGDTETGRYEIYENVIVANYGQKDVIIEYEIANGDVQFITIK